MATISQFRLSSLSTVKTEWQSILYLSDKYNEKMKRSGWKGQINIQKLKWHVSTITDVFFNHKRINVCEHRIKMVPQYQERPHRSK